MLSDKCKDAVITAVLTGTSLPEPQRKEFMVYLVDRWVGTTNTPSSMLMELLDVTPSQLEHEMGEQLRLYCCCGCDMWSYEIDENGYCPDCNQAGMGG